MSERLSKKLPPFLKTVYLSNREIRLILAGLYSLNMPKEEIEGTRLELSMEENLQVKVRWARLRDDFVVKARLDPALAELKALQAKREEKKRRKAKLNKKRRKK